MFINIKHIKEINGFRFGTFVGRFPSDGAASMAVKGLKTTITIFVCSWNTMLLLPHYIMFLNLFCTSTYCCLYPWCNVFHVNKTWRRRRRRRCLKSISVTFYWARQHYVSHVCVHSKSSVLTTPWRWYTDPLTPFSWPAGGPSLNRHSL